VWSHEAIEACNPAVLAVVDNAANERSIAGRLAGCRFEVDFVPQLERAIEALRRRPYDVLVIDLALPGEAGRSLLFRAQMLAPRIPVVLMTGHPDEDLALQALTAGVQDYLVTDGEAPVDLSLRLRHAVIRHGQMRRSRHAASRSSHDPATGLPSRDAFLRKLQDVLAFAARLRERPALLQIRLGNLGEVRDRLGPVVAVRLLREIGRRLTWCVRRADSLGRLEEDFAVLLPNATTVSAIHMVAERVRVTAALPCESEGASVRFRTNIGAAWFPVDGDTLEDLLAAAQVALKEARTLGEGRCVLFRGHDLPAWPEDVINDFRLAKPGGMETETGDGLAGAQP
jgi:diguanylate cyclase (GGDEF)-like protein